MSWVKVTPETMPKDYERVLVTCVDSQGYRFVVQDAFCEDGEWRVVKDWTVFMTEKIKNGVVTHWMPYPAPAED